MKRKLVTYFPLAVLALGLTLGMAAAFMALRPSSGVPTIDAAHTTHSTQSFTVTQSPATVGELSEYVFTFSVTGTVAGIGAALMPANVAEIRLTFDDSAQLPASIPANAVLVQASFLTNVAEITTGLACADTSANAAYHSAGGADMAVELSMSPTFDVDITDSARKIVIIKVPDMNPTTGTGSCGAGAQGIAAGARVIVTFTTSAGIKNRTEATTSGDYDIQACSAACVSPATTNVVTGHSSGALVTVANVTTKAKLTLSSINGARGSTVTAVAKGLKDGQTATFWLDRDTMDMNCDGDKTDTLTSRDETDIGGSAGVDLNDDGDCTDSTVSMVEATVGHDLNCDGDLGDTSTPSELAAGAFAFDLNGDGDCTDTGLTALEAALPGDNIHDAGETDLATVIVAADDTATVTFTVNNPPFSPGKVNSIAVMDGRATKMPTPYYTTLPKYEVRGVVTTTPTTVRVGDTITIQMKDFDAGCDLESSSVCTGYTSIPKFTLGGVDWTQAQRTAFAGTSTTTSTGEASFTTIIPNGVPSGTQSLEVRNACCIGGGGAAETLRANLIVSGAILILTPETVVPNQTLNIVGNNFSSSDVATTVTINEETVTSSTSDCAGTAALSGMTIQGVAIARAKINEGNTISVAAGGNWSASILIPVSVTTSTPGTYELKVTDCAGRVGRGNIIIPARVVTMEPKQGQVGTPVKITGTGFPASNGRTNNVSTNISVTYNAGSAGGTATGSGQADSSGNISFTLTVPTNANIPSDNNITTSFDTESPVSSVVNTVVHSVPRASMTIKPSSGKSGTRVTATVKGAKAYSTITTALIGASLDVRPAPTPMTDSIGNVTFEFTVPQMDAGVQNLEVAIGTTTASAAFVVDAPAAVVQVVTPTAPITVANALGTPLGADFVRAFYFNNATKAWSFNDPRPEFAAINTLKEVDGGKVYWVNVGNDKTITFCGRSVTFTKGWNQIAC